MFKMVDGTGIIGVDMICPLGVSAPQPPNYDRVELEGTGMLVLPNSLDAPLERLELGGKTEQVQTSGKNLANANVYEQGYLTSVNAGDKVSLTQMQKSFTTNMEVSSMQGKNVSVSVRTKGKTGKRYVFADETDTIITGVFDTGNNNYSEFKNITIPKNAKKLFFSVTYDAQENTELQVELGTTVTTYEPYTGGKPSPSPEYPQEIKNSGKWNEEKQKYDVDVKVTGKNLLNLQKEPDVKGLYQGWKVGNGDKGTLSIKDKGNNADISECYFGLNSDGTTSYSVTWLVDNGVIKRYHIESIEKMYACMYPPNETIIKKITERFEIQYEYGSIATEYQPYKEQLLTLTSDRPLTKWDRLVEQGGQIGWLYKSRIAEIPKTGYALKNTSENRYGVYFSKLSIFKDAVVTKGSPEKDSNIFTHFKLGNPYASNGNIAWLYVAGGNTDLRIKVEDETINTVELFEQYISDKDIKILYETESTEFVPLPKEEQNAIRALKTYYPTTVITVDGGELDPDIKVTYRKEI